MIPNTVEQYFHVFKSKSRILNRPAPDPRQRPRYFEAMDFSLSGLERLIQERKELHEAGKEAVRKASEEWKHFMKIQLIPRGTKPLSNFAEKLNLTKAKVLLYEAEVRELHAMKQKLLVEGEKEKQALHRNPVGAVKFRGGVPHSCDGRDLHMHADGKVRFVDSKELLSEHLGVLEPGLSPPPETP